jgi:hypothetical protein
MHRTLLLGAAALIYSWFTPVDAHAAQFGAKYSLPTIPSLCSGSRVTVPVSVTNTGALTWTATGATAFHLSYHWYKGTLLDTYNGERTVLPHDIIPGETVLLQANLKAPSTPGTYVLKWDMVEEAVTWFSGQGVPTADEGASVSLAVVCLPFVFKLQPEINSASSEVWPGLAFLIEGRFFLNGGTVVLKGNFGGSSEIDLPILFWNSDVIVAVVPENLTGVMDQTATLEVRRSDGETASVQTMFEATRQILMIGQTDVTFSCSDFAWRNRCNGVGDEPFECCTFRIDPLTTLAGSHQDYNLLGAIGTDTVSFDLKNGWVTYDVTSSDTVSVTGFQPKVSSGTVAAAWHTDGNIWDPVRYYVAITAIGPIGVPFK